MPDGTRMELVLSAAKSKGEKNAVNPMAVTFRHPFRSGVPGSADLSAAEALEQAALLLALCARHSKAVEDHEGHNRLFIAGSSFRPKLLDSQCVAGCSDISRVRPLKTSRASHVQPTRSSGSDQIYKMASAGIRPSSHVGGGDGTNSR